MKETELLTEGWVTFTRFYCKDGYLDRWLGDCINDPNKPNKSTLQLNASATFWRCNSGGWVRDQKIGRSAIWSLLEIREGYSAEEIWNELLKLER